MLPERPKLDRTFFGRGTTGCRRRFFDGDCGRRSAIFVSLQPGGCHGVNVLLLVRSTSSTRERDTFPSQSPAIASRPSASSNPPADELRSAARKKSQKICELEDETDATASARGNGMALHENPRERATLARYYLRRTTRRRSASAGRLAAPPSRGHARRFASAPLAPRAI